MSIAIIGAGAFGTGLANALAAEDNVIIWGRDAAAMQVIQETRTNEKRLAGVKLNDRITATADLQTALAADVILLCLPTQQISAFLKTNSDALFDKTLVSCCKGIDLASGQGPVDLMIQIIPSATSAILTGPSFAIDIAKGLPTALTIASASLSDAETLQRLLSTQTLRLYASDDIQGAQMGGALKNVIAIGCGALMGAGLGESARAALITRGFAEMQRFGQSYGAELETLSGLSGFGDLVLTCTSPTSRNYRFGYALGTGTEWTSEETVEGATTAKAIAKIALAKNIDMPITQNLCQLINGDITLSQAVAQLFSRPLTTE
jgi:glycerol-3-phosphate dehydrogenase (NAD(P)+)